jgi:DNA-binding MarR family transcriptional regulator
MSNAAMTWAWSDETADLSPGELFVLVVLADHASDHSGEPWKCYPAIERIVARTHFSRSAVERHLKRLALAGFLSRTRRKRPDGKLGIYDYVLERDSAERARLRAVRGAVDNPVHGSPEPCGESPHGPCGNLPKTMRQFDEKPCGELPHEEPLEEPLLKPSLRARVREPGDEGFGAGLAAYPLSGRQRTDEPKARAAWALAMQDATPAELTAAVARYAAEDPGLKRGDFGAPSFHGWLSGKRYRAWIVPPSASVAGTARFPDMAVRNHVVCLRGEVFAASYLDRAGWDPVGRVISPATGVARAKLASLPAAFFADLPVTLAQGRSA